MEFNSIIKANLLPILIRYGFKIEKEFKNIIRFQSSAIKVNIVFSTFENSHLLKLMRILVNYLGEEQILVERENLIDIESFQKEMLIKLLRLLKIINNGLGKHKG